MGDAGGEGIVLGIAMERPMSKPSKPFPFPAGPRQLPRLALAAAIAPVGTVLTGTHALAQRLGASFATCATEGGPCPAGSQVAALAFCLVGAFAWIACSISFWQLRKRRRHVSPMLPVSMFLVAFLAVVAGAWMATASPILIGSGSDVPDAVSQSIRFE